MLARENSMRNTTIIISRWRSTSPDPGGRGRRFGSTGDAVRVRSAREQPPSGRRKPTTSPPQWRIAMYRSLLALFVAVPLFAAPVPKDKDVLYFPTKEGTKLVYEVTVGSGKKE